MPCHILWEGTVQEVNNVKADKLIARKERRHNLKKYAPLYFFFIPSMLFIIIFKYVPMAGLVMAFKENPRMLAAASPVQAIRGELRPVVMDCFFPDSDKAVVDQSKF